MKLKLHHFKWILGLIILVLCAWYVYARLIEQNQGLPNWQAYREMLSNPNTQINLMLVLGLTVINWGLEAIKWRYLLSFFHRISLFKAYASTLAGLAVTILTPYRVGSFLGRVLVLPEHTRYRAVVASAFGGLAQLFITVIFGLLAIMFYQSDTFDVMHKIVIGSSTALLSIICFIYFYPHIWISFLNRNLKKNRFSESFEILTAYNLKAKLTVIGISAVRYLVFLIQFYLILNIFSDQFDFIELGTPISIVFLLVTISPTVLYGLGVREAASVLILSAYFSDSTIITLASLLLWLFNMIVPASIGAFVLLLNKKPE